MQKIPTLDTTFLVAFTGLTWFIRISFIIKWIQGLTPEIIKANEGIAVGLSYMLVMYAFFSTGYDINTIRNKRYFEKRFKNQTIQKYRFSIAVVISILCAIFLSSGILYTTFAAGVEYIGVGLFFLFLVIFTVTPMISVITITIKKLHEKPYIPIGRLKIPK